MQVTVTGRHMAVSDPMREYAEEKVAKLVKYYDRIESIDVILSHEKTQVQIEVVVHADHRNTFVGQVQAKDLHEVVDLVVDKLARQLREHKAKVRSRKHIGKTEGQD